MNAKEGFMDAFTGLSVQWWFSMGRDAGSKGGTAWRIESIV